MKIINSENNKRVSIVSKVLLIPMIAISANCFADITITKNSIVCEKESGIIAVTAMKEQRKARTLPDSCRLLEFSRKGNLEKVGNRHYVQVKTKMGDRFYTLTKSIKNK